MKIPEKVKVGPLDYSVEIVPGTFLNGTTAVDGTHNCMDTVIKVANVGNEDYKNTVFMHELLHAIDYVYCGDIFSENQIEQLSKGIYQVIKDHPDMFK